MIVGTYSQIFITKNLPRNKLNDNNKKNKTQILCRMFYCFGMCMDNIHKYCTNK